MVVANRTHERAVRLAESLDVPSRAVELSALDTAMADADLVVSCGTASLVVTAGQLTARGVGDDGRRRFFLDLALPHDIELTVRDLDGVELAGLDDLRTEQEAAKAIGPAAVDAARRIVCEEVEAFLSAARAAAVAPTVVALRSMAAEVVDAELSRLTGRCPRWTTGTAGRSSRPYGAWWTSCCTRRPSGSRSWRRRRAATPTPTRCASCSTWTRRRPRPWPAPM